MLSGDIGMIDHDPPVVFQRWIGRGHLGPVGGPKFYHDVNLERFSAAENA